MLTLGQLLTAGLYLASFLFAVAIGLIATQYYLIRQSSRFCLLLIFGSLGVAFLAVWAINFRWAIAVPLLLYLSLSIIFHFLLKDFIFAGSQFLTAICLGTVFGLAWGVEFVATIPISPLTRNLIWIGYSPLLLSLNISLAHTWERCEVMCRKIWRRPRKPLPAKLRKYYPKVSLHVPVHAEPPEIVCATLEALARLQYPNFEVLVIDNNTRDRRLWQPLKNHCHKLGDRFRFFHVEGLTGAKAGALNFALRHTANDAELVAVVDSDYQAEPDFLACLVGYFDDAKMGWVQTRHAYREWQNSPYLRMCNWEYRVFFATTMVSRNERNAALTVGTMCLIRRQALEEVGGWAQWCVTEDSELAIRIHARGYTSVYLNATFGRGLIPETFASYKQQRFRWTYGPIQELKQHFWLLLPLPFQQTSALSLAQKFHHLIHGLENLTFGLGLLLFPLGVALLGSIVWHQEVIEIPLVLWLTAIIGLVTQPLLELLLYQAIVKCSVRDALGAMVASAALGYTRSIASFWALFTRTIPWHRTNKFKTLPSGWRVFNSVRGELLFGMTPLGLASVALALLPQSQFLLMFFLLSIPSSFNALAAVFMAFLAERDIKLRNHEL